MSKIPVAIDLFSGCGGISTGLLDAGVRVVAGFDSESRAIEAYNYNHNYRGARGFIADLETLSGKQLLAMANVPSIDLLAGGPPCQAFSIVGHRKGLTDHRGTLVFNFIHLVEELSPSVFMMENVPNLLSVNDGAVFAQFRRSFEDLGYKVSWAIVAAANYGVPQMRKRLIVAGTKGKVAITLPPPPTHIPNERTSLLQNDLPSHVTCREAIGDLPDVESRKADMVPNHEPTQHGPSMLKALAQLIPGKRDKKSFHDRLHPDRLSYTLRAGNGNFSPLRPIHYKYHRVISVRESARLQGFSDNFLWPDSIPRLQQYRQVGNSVPPPLASAIARQCAKAMGWSLAPDKFKGNPLSRPQAFTLSRAQRDRARISRIRGASLGAAIGSLHNPR